MVYNQEPTNRYLGIWLDEKLAFDVHINYLVKRLKPRLSLLFRKKKKKNVFTLQLERE